MGAALQMRCRAQVSSELSTSVPAPAPGPVVTLHLCNVVMSFSGHGRATNECMLHVHNCVTAICPWPHTHAEHALWPRRTRGCASALQYTRQGCRANSAALRCSSRMVLAARSGGAHTTNGMEPWSTKPTGLTPPASRTRYPSAHLGARLKKADCALHRIWPHIGSTWPRVGHNLTSS